VKFHKNKSFSEMKLDGASYRVILLVKNRNWNWRHQPETGELVLLLLGVLRKMARKFKVTAYLKMAGNFE